ncbi:STY4851/ECs_5259 family protein [Rhodoplanes azumiensis]|uniref:STY4851/ECs_5259 family protein n=1 Tax=Rhodoplanes azumiensis TaxID=1897628 RepID=A0ABW5ASE4_9BRAD
MSEGDYGSLSGLPDGQLVRLFRERGRDPRFLETLNDELKRRTTDAAIDLQFEVVQARRALSQSAFPGRPQAARSHPDTLQDWLHAFLRARNIGGPDERAFYRYRMTDKEYVQVKSILRDVAQAGRLEKPDYFAGALFVAYCAEWFRRESDTTFLRWDDPAPDIFPSVPYASKQELTNYGLAYWRRKLRRSEHVRKFLLTVALEGGFPVRILADGGRGWLKDYLRAIMRRAIAGRAETADEILAIAEEERGRMRKSYQHDDFVALCSEFAAKLLQLRRKAEAEGAGGIRNSALLDAKYPDWRDELPVYVPAEDEALVAELLTGLLDEKMTGLVTAGVEVKRFLVKRDGEWRPAVQLVADGEIRSEKLPGLTALSRVRAIATGELSNHLAGEVALFEPPAGEQRRWRVRPFFRTAKLLPDFPFAAPVTVTLSSPDSPPQSWTWHRGDAVRSDVLVFEPDEGSTEQQPLLRFVRSGSVSSPAKTLFVLVPDHWMVEPVAEGTETEIEDVPALRRKLARLTSATHFHADEAEAVRFRVEPDADAQERELDLPVLVDTTVVPADGDWDLVATPAKVRIRENGSQPRAPRPGELFVRRPGGRWSPLTASLDAAGLIELSWRDSVADIQIEKRRLALLPVGARIDGTMKDALTGEIRLHGLPGWTATVPTASCAVDASRTDVLAIRFSGRPVYRLPLTLHPPSGTAFDVIVPLVGRDAVVALADGSILPPGRRIDVGALRGAVVVSPGRSIVHLAPKGARSSGIKTIVDGELPLGVLRSSIDEMLATLPGQDDLVELDFLGDTRQPIRISRYRLDRLVHDGDLVRRPESSRASGIAPVARMILDPRHEHALEDTGDGHWRLPERCKGLCLVYARDGIDVVSRPVPIVRPGSPAVHFGRLVSALTILDFEERQRAIVEALSCLGHDDGSTSDVTWLRDAAANLNGLPATAIDALRLLPADAEALLNVLFAARDAGDRGAIWSLQNSLPFLWLALPVRAWATVMTRTCESSVRALKGTLGQRVAMEHAIEWLRDLSADLTALEPAVQAIFDTAGLPAPAAAPVPSLRELTDTYIRDQHHRGGEAPNDIASRLSSAGLKLPSEIGAKSHESFAGLFAPVLLAASARGRLTLQGHEMLLVRRVLREDPTYVSAAWRHLLKFYGSK